MCDSSGDFSVDKFVTEVSLVTKCQTSQEIINNLQQSLCRKKRALKTGIYSVHIAKIYLRHTYSIYLDYFRHSYFRKHCN